MKWLSTVKQADAGKLVLERMEPRRVGLAADRRARGARGGRTRPRARAGDRPRPRGVPGLEVDDGVVKVGPDLMTGYPGIFAGGDMVPAERTVTVGVGHGKQAARSIEAAPRRGGRERAGARARRIRAPEHLVLHGRSPVDAAAARAGSTPVHVRGGRRRLRRVDGPVRGAALPLVRQLLLLRQLLRGLPRQRGTEAGRRGGALRLRLRLLQGLRDLRRGVPVRRDRDGPRRDLRRERRGGASRSAVGRTSFGEPWFDRLPVGPLAALETLLLGVLGAALVLYVSARLRDRVAVRRADWAADDRRRHVCRRVRGVWDARLARRLPRRALREIAERRGPVLLLPVLWFLVLVIPALVVAVPGAPSSPR